MAERKLIQYWILERQIKAVRSVIEKACDKFRREDDKYYFTMGDTISLIVREWGKEKGFINGLTEPIDNAEFVRNDVEEREYFETMIRAVEKEPTAGCAKELWSMVLKMNPEYRAPKEFATKALVVEAKRLLER